MGSGQARSRQLQAHVPQQAVALHIDDLSLSTVCWASGLDLPHALLHFSLSPGTGRSTSLPPGELGTQLWQGPRWHTILVGSLLRVRASVRALLERMAQRRRKPGFVPRHSL